MRCFTVTECRPPREGIALVRDERLGLCVALGERGRGRYLELVKLDSRRPPTVVEAPDAPPRVMSAGVVAYDVPGRDGGSPRRYHALVGERDDGRVLVAIDTAGPYTRGSVGSTQPLRGEPRKLCEGNTASGDAGRIGAAEHSLHILSEGDAVRVRPEGGFKTRPYVVELVGGALRCVDAAEDEAAHALAGEGTAL